MAYINIFSVLHNEWHEIFLILFTFLNQDVRIYSSTQEGFKNEKKGLLLLSLVTSISACDMTGIAVTKSEQTICIDNVTYVKFSEGNVDRGLGYMSVKLDTNSKIILCGEVN